MSHNQELKVTKPKHPLYPFDGHNSEPGVKSIINHYFDLKLRNQLKEQPYKLKSKPTDEACSRQTAISVDNKDIFNLIMAFPSPQSISL